MIATNRAPAVRRNSRLNLALLAAAGLLLALTIGAIATLAAPPAVTGTPAAQMVTLTVSSDIAVHPTGHGGCYVRTPQHYAVTLLGGGVRNGTLSDGQLTANGSCAFSTTLPALTGATDIIVNGGEHTITSGTGQITLSSDDGHWTPVHTGQVSHGHVL